MALNIHKHHLAEQDLIDIWLYTYREWGEAQADHYLDTLDSAIQILRHNPELGRNIDHISSGYRLLHAEKHMVIYRLGSHTVHVIRVLGHQMDVGRHLAQP